MVEGEMREPGEPENEEVTQKKSRHRKKQLFNSILQQMEFYFSDSNLSKDRFLSQLIQQDPFVDLAIFLKFNKLRKLTEDIEDIKKAVKKSKHLKLSEDENKISRIAPVKIRHDVDDCTLYVEKIGSDANHEFLTSIFSDFGNVTYVSIPKYKHNHVNKGFAFVEFETIKEADSALEFFENLGCKMSANIDPQELCSVSSYLKEQELENSSKIKSENEENAEELVKQSSEESRTIETEQSTGVDEKKRKRSDALDEPNKKLKGEDLQRENSTETHTEDIESKKKKKKDLKKKTFIKELGIQVLPKKDWKKMRNHYLDLQRKKMKELKTFLNKAKYSNSNYATKKTPESNSVESKSNQEASTALEQPAKLDFTPGVIVKITLNESSFDEKKLKTEMKSASSEIKYVDIPLPAGSQEIFIRLTSNKAANEFCGNQNYGVGSVLEGDSEKQYWEKLQNDRNVKFNRNVKKQRGRDRLLKKAAKEAGKHIRFEEAE